MNEDVSDGYDAIETVFGLEPSDAIDEDHYESLDIERDTKPSVQTASPVTTPTTGIYVSHSV